MVQMERTVGEISRSSHIFPCVVNVPIKLMVQMEGAACTRFLYLLIFPCVVNLLIQPMDLIERAQEIFRYSPITQIKPVQLKIQLYQHHINFNWNQCCACANMMSETIRYTLYTTYTDISWIPPVYIREIWLYYDNIEIKGIIWTRIRPSFH